MMLNRAYYDFMNFGVINSLLYQLKNKNKNWVTCLISITLSKKSERGTKSENSAQFYKHNLQKLMLSLPLIVSLILSCKSHALSMSQNLQIFIQLHQSKTMPIKPKIKLWLLLFLWAFLFSHSFSTLCFFSDFLSFIFLFFLFGTIANDIQASSSFMVCNCIKSFCALFPFS